MADTRGSHGRATRAGDTFPLRYYGDQCQDLYGTDRTFTSEVQFYFHMHTWGFADNGDAADIRLKDANGVVRWSISGNQGTDWQASPAVPLPTMAFDIEVVLCKEGGSRCTYSAGDSTMWRPDVGLDAVTVNCRFADGHAPPPYPPVPPASPPPTPPMDCDQCDAGSSCGVCLLKVPAAECPCSTPPPSVCWDQLPPCTSIVSVGELCNGGSVPGSRRLEAVSDQVCKWPMP